MTLKQHGKQFEWFKEPLRTLREDYPKLLGMLDQYIAYVEIANGVQGVVFMPRGLELYSLTQLVKFCEQHHFQVMVCGPNVKIKNVELPDKMVVTLMQRDRLENVDRL